MDKLRVGWGIKARRNEEKIKRGRRERQRNGAGKKKNQWDVWIDMGRKGKVSIIEMGGIEDIEVKYNERDNLETELINREKDIQRQWQEGRISNARYNMKYKEIEVEGRGPRYLRSENLNKIGKGDKVKALIKLRCGNMEGANKYWLEESHWGCTFCKEGRECRTPSEGMSDNQGKA